MKLLFLGGTSYLGKEIIKRLENQGGHEITIVYRDTPLTGIEEQDIVFNLVVDYGKGNKSLTEVMAANVSYPINALEKLQFKTVINFSTALDKDLSHYSFSKKTLEEALAYLGQQKSWQVINLQLQHFFGPGAPEHNFVSFLINKMKSGEEIPLTDCQQKRDFIFTPDLLDAIDVIIRALPRLGDYESIELGSGTAMKLQDFVELIKDFTKSSSTLKFGVVPKRLNEPFELVANTSKIKGLGWKQATSIEEALKQTIGL